MSELHGNEGFQGALTALPQLFHSKHLEISVCMLVGYDVHDTRSITSMLPRSLLTVTLLDISLSCRVSDTWRPRMWLGYLYDLLSSTSHSGLEVRYSIGRSYAHWQVRDKFQLIGLFKR